MSDGTSRPSREWASWTTYASGKIVRTALESIPPPNDSAMFDPEYISALESTLSNLNWFLKLRFRKASSSRGDTGTGNTTRSPTNG